MSTASELAPVEVPVEVRTDLCEVLLKGQVPHGVLALARASATCANGHLEEAAMCQRHLRNLLIGRVFCTPCRRSGVKTPLTVLHVDGL